MSKKWLPLAPLGTDCWTVCDKFVPTRAGSYAPNNMFSSVTSPGLSSPGTTTRAWCALTTSDTAVGYVGTTTKLFTYDGVSTFANRSRGGTSYTSNTRPWSFVQYGDITLATNRGDVIQFRDATTTNNFADVAGTPLGSILVSQAEQILMFDLNSGGTEYRDGFATSAPGDYTDWTSANATTATHIRHRPGRITAACAFSDYVLVCKQSSVYKLRYTSSSEYRWQVQLIASNRGAWSVHDLINCGDFVIMSGPGGVWKYDGTNWTLLTRDFGQVPYSSKGATYSHLSGNVTFWNDTNGYTYNIESDRWGVWVPARKNVNAYALPQSTGAFLMGDVAAVNTFLAPTMTVPDLVMLFCGNLASEPVYKSDLLWGSATVVAGSAATLGSPVYGEGDDRIARISRVNMDYTCTISRSGDIAPSATELGIGVYGANGARDAWAIFDGTALISNATSSTEQRRFDVRVARNWVRFVLSMDCNAGYTEILEMNPVMADTGRT